MASTAKKEADRIIGKLRVAIRLLGFTNREIERRLGYTPSYLTRLFSGQIELRFEHIVDIARAMGLRADEFFAFAYPARSDPPSETAGQLEALLEELRPSPRPPKAPSSLSGDLTEEKIQTELQKLFIDWVDKLEREKVKSPRKRRP